MRKLLLVLSLLLLLPAFAAAEESVKDKMKDTFERLMGTSSSGGAGEGEDKDKKPDKNRPMYKIHLYNGGTLQTDNYDVEEKKIRVVFPAGDIYLDRAMVKSIEEIKGEDGESIQKVFQNEPAPTPKPQEQPKPYRPSAGQPSPERKRAAGDTDYNGHDKEWWKAKADEWKEKLSAAERKYAKAQDDWNKYNGLLGTAEQVPVLQSVPVLDSKGNPVFKDGQQVFKTITVSGSGVSDFQTEQYQDLRGSARVEMDKAQAQIDEAKHMLNEVLPDEARKAGAPPGWTR